MSKRSFSIVPRYINLNKCEVRSVYTQVTIYCLDQRNSRVRGLKGEGDALTGLRGNGGGGGEGISRFGKSIFFFSHFLEI